MKSLSISTHNQFFLILLTGAIVYQGYSPFLVEERRRLVEQVVELKGRIKWMKYNGIYKKLSILKRSN
ncbi:hypothetical protein DFR57_1155 [Saliterribacillus persicus]|uniref:Uncharacterized protein n=1 Tax=Saliterribacillus persicus TaxID=930114 RepID=A0A368X7A1_9BACI|nr:hypothetical protein DFR57_1155 [Saliterribacillus persicus]